MRCSGLYNPSHTDLPYSLISHCYSRIVFDTCVSSYHKQVQHLLTSKFDTLIPHFVCAGDDRLATVLEYEAHLKSLTAQSELYQAREAMYLLPVTENPQVREEGGEGR